MIRITDDGTGIHEHDLPLSLDRHATSKLSNEEDLLPIGTLGFRGEALASIGMVSKLSISSRPRGTEGRSIVMDNGNKGKSSLLELQKEPRSKFRISFLINLQDWLSNADRH